jgi:transmembrane sensor
VRLEGGEALFQVAKDAARPFVVHAGNASVRAVGTEFNVRMRERHVVEVTVTEGVVAVDGSPANPGTADDPATAPVRKVAAGEGAMLGVGAVASLALDAESLEQRIAWRRDVIELRGETLEQAVAEFNRYRPEPLVLGDPRIGSIRVGGTFATDESAKFLDALQTGFGIKAVEGAQGRVYLVSAQ